MFAAGRHQGGRHHLGLAADRKPAGTAFRRRRRAVAVAAVSLAIPAITFVALSSPATAAQPLARATLVDMHGVEVGKVVFKGVGKYANRVKVDINAPKAPNLGSFHGLHIHTTGACNPEPSGLTLVPFGSAGGHFNPDPGQTHGAHAGDLPSVLLTASGEAYAEVETARFDVSSLLDADGSAVVLHAAPDNFANIPTRSPYPPAPDATTLATGDAGGRYACGVVEAQK